MKRMCYLVLIAVILIATCVPVYAAQEAIVLKPDQPYTISMGMGRTNFEIFPVTGLQGINLRMGFGNGGQLEISFYFEKTADGFYTISPASMPGWYLQSAEDKITVGKAQDIPEQKWSITPCDDGYTISSATNPTLFIGQNDDTSRQTVALLAEPDDKVWKIKESQLEFSKQSLYVKAPEHWAPGLEGHYGGWNIGVMAQQENGWFSFPLWPTVDKIDYGLIANLMVSIPGDQFSVQDASVYLEQLEPDKDYWVVISDDPNVDGDLTYKIYDYNPDEPPKTADPVMLALPVVTLLSSATAMICLLRRKKIA